MALLWSVSSWAQSGTVLAGTTGEGTPLASDSLVGVDHRGTVVVDTTGEGPVLASVRSVGVGSGSHCCGGHDR
jgi:hypothetical protein